MRKKIAAGNWKMNLLFEEAISLTKEIVSGHRNAGITTILAVPYPYINKIISIVEGHDHIFVAAQNCHHQSAGAHTGEVSIAMLESLRVPYVILGHSERRADNGDSDDILNAKLELVLGTSINPIFCCGEPLELRKSGQHINYVIEQLSNTILRLTPDQLNRVVIAYEPIWAIGTGETATAEQAQEMHQAIRQAISNKFGKEVAESISILYGGSVKSSNAEELFSKSDVDGGLVGGASLKGEEFLKIINSF